MENETNTVVEETQKPRMTKKLAVKIAAGALAFGGVCALAIGVAKSGHKTTD